jgi:hypothetical protein
VNYQQVAASDAYAATRALTAALRVADLRALSSDSEKLAFWINLYNFLVLDAVIQLGVKQSVTKVRGFFDRIGYHIGGHFFSAHDIEQGILRANAGHPALPGPQFPPKSPLVEYTVSRLDFRIHFALNCGAQSCPPIAFYDGDCIHAQLDLAARSFLNSSEVEVDMQKREVALSKILQWFAVDFGAAPRVALGFGDTSPILRSIAPFITDDERRNFLENEAGSVNVTFKPYDWSLNRFYA